MGTFVSEPISVPRRISGTAIIADLCRRISERLSRQDNLRGVDSFTSYSCRISLDLTLIDVDEVTMTQELVIGTSPVPPAPAEPVPPPGRIAIEVRGHADELAVAENLERAVDGSEVEAPPAPADNLSRTRPHAPAQAKTLSHRHLTE
jgi:hypothetical protein